jgi:hypothetical protein
VVAKDLDVFAVGAVSLSHILQACTKPLKYYWGLFVILMFFLLSYHVSK